MVKPDDLSSISGSHTVKEESLLSQVDLHAWTMTRELLLSLLSSLLNLVPMSFPPSLPTLHLLSYLCT